MTDRPNPDADDTIGRILGDFLAGSLGQPQDRPEIEPSADLIALASNLYEQYVAYQRVGFAEQQAFALIRTALNALLLKGPGQ